MAAWVYKHFWFGWSDKLEEYVHWPEGMKHPRSKGLPMDDILKMYGRDGWEVVAVTPQVWELDPTTYDDVNTKRVTVFMTTMRHRYMYSPRDGKP